MKENTHEYTNVHYIKKSVDAQGINKRVSQQLVERGIQNAAQKAGWFDMEDFWEFPVYDPHGAGEIIAKRRKFKNPTNGCKYNWVGSKPGNETGNFYFIPGILNAINAANGICYLANGEPSVLAFHEARIQNVICTTLSEISIPPNVTKHLYSYGITRLINIPDNDEAGRNGAIKWRDALRGSGIDYECLSWGDVAEKFDANDLWVEVGFNAEAFCDHLKNLSEMKLPSPVQEPENQQEYSDYNTHKRLIDEVASILNITEWKADGWSRKNISSPFREDKNPSASFNRNSGVLYDFGGDSHSIWDVARVLGVDATKYRTQSPSQNKKISKRDLCLLPENPMLTTLAANDKFYDERGFSDYMISALLILSGKNSKIPFVASRLVSAAAQGKLPIIGDDTGASRKVLMEVTLVSRPTINDALKELEELAFVKKLNAKENSLIEFNSFTNTSKVRGASILYQINISDDSIRFMLEGLRKKYVMHYIKKCPPIDELMAGQFDIDKSLCDAFNKIVYDTSNYKELSFELRAIDQEMSGFIDWPGWKSVLSNPRDSDFSSPPENLTTANAWRQSQIKRLNKTAPNLKNKERFRQLGTLSKGTLKNIRDEAHLVSEPQKPKSITYYVETNDRTAKRRRFWSLIKKSAKEYNGRVIEAELTIKDEVNSITLSLLNPSFMEIFDKYCDVLQGYSFTIQTGSTYRDMTEKEIVEAQQKLELKRERERNRREESKLHGKSTSTNRPKSASVATPHTVTEYDPKSVLRRLSQIHQETLGYSPSNSMTHRDIVCATVEAENKTSGREELRS